MSETTHLVLRAPLSGIVVPLESVPDPVFAQRMVGDGVSIDPITSLVAPCDDHVVQIHSAGHAVTLASNDGIEVLMHSLDTVQLKGRGFTARVKTGDVVRGDVLIDFDADYVATHARSLMTEVIIVHRPHRCAAAGVGIGESRDGHDSERDADQRPRGGESGDSGRGPVRAVGGVQSVRAACPPGRGAHQPREAIRVGYPAAPRTGRGDARSVVGIMGLEIAHGDRIELVASGSDADEAVRALSQLVLEGLGEEGAAPASNAVAVVDVARRAQSDDPMFSLAFLHRPALPWGTSCRCATSSCVWWRMPTMSGPSDRRSTPPSSVRRRSWMRFTGAFRRKAPAASSVFAAHRELLDDLAC